ncbi:MAG TPA: hypothetical protein VMJ92_04330 [Candidatus Limnocylindrales bacterium]|nr:hypothetical protein [Candidatus Limnocylindrales bacterium]
MVPEGMVHALHAARRALRPGGLLIDLRPDRHRAPRVAVAGRVAGELIPGSTAMDEAADTAAEALVAEGALRPIERGHLWYRHTFRDRRELDEYIASAARVVGYGRAVAARLAASRGPVVMRRSLAFAIYERRV